MARPSRAPAPDRAAHGLLDLRRAARLARRRGGRHGCRRAARRRPGRGRLPPSPPATPTGPTRSPPATPCVGSGSSTPHAMEPPRVCSPPRWPRARAGAADGRAARPGGPRRDRRRWLPRRPPHLREGVGVNVDTFEANPDWTQALADAALGEGEMKAVEVAGVAILIVRRGGDVFALSDRCVHRGGSLADGELVGDCVECPLHGSRFRARGRVRGAGAGRLPPARARDAGARRLDRGAGRPPRLSYYAAARLGERTPRPAATPSAPRAADRGRRGHASPSGSRSRRSASTTSSPPASTS